jgi:hypothetical protein
MNTQIYFQFMQESPKGVSLVLYTFDLPSSHDITTTTFADTSILAIDPSLNLNAIQHWLSLWRLKTNGSKGKPMSLSPVAEKPVP